MKTLKIARDILPLGELKTHAAQAVRQVKKTHRPLVITQNGRAAAVLIAPEEYDRLTEEAQFKEAVEEGLADLDAGRSVSDEEMGRILDARLGRTSK
jgi:prevent-host-death family protein